MLCSKKNWRHVCTYCPTRVFFSFNNKSVLFLLIIAFVTEATEAFGWVLEFCKICIADLFKRSDGGLVVLFLLKHTFKTKTFRQILWKRKKLAAVLFSVTCFIYTVHEKAAATPNFSAARLFWKNSNILTEHRKKSSHSSRERLFWKNPRIVQSLFS